MGKDKKGKKGRQEEDFGEEEVDVDNAKAAGNDASGNTKVVKKGKKGRRKDDDWEEDVAKEIEALSLDNSIASNLKSASSKNEAENKKLLDDEPDFSFTSKKEKKKKKEIEYEGEDVDEEVLRTKQSKNQKGKKDKDEGSDEDDEFKWDNKGARKKGKAIGSDDEDEIINGKQPKKQKGKKGKLFGSDEEDILVQKKDNKVTKKKSKSVISDDEELIEQTEKIQPKKQKGRKAKGDFSDEEFEHVVDQKKDTKVKKKGMKGKGDVSVDEDETNDVEIKTKKQKDKGDKVKKKGKKSKGKGIGSDEEEDEEEPVLRSKASKKDNVGKIKTKTGFQLLEMEDMDIDDDSNDDISVEIEVTATAEKEKDTKLKNQLKPDSVETEDQDIDIKKDDKGSKKSKKKERRKRDDDEEVDKMLEELAMEIEGKKPPEKAKEKVKDGIEDTLAEGEIKPEEISEKQSKKKKKKKDLEPQEEKKEEDKEPQVEETVEEEDRTVKTAAQKKKEKKERERQKKLAHNEQDRSKKKGDTKAEETKLDERAEKIETKDTEAPVVVDEDDTDDKKKKRKKKKDEEEKKDKKRPGKKQIAAMQEALKKVKEEEERLRLEEEAKQKAAEEVEQKRLEKLRLEQERKEKKKQKEKEKRERLKAEGKLLTRSQRQARARMEATLQALRQQGVEVPQIGEKKERAPRLGDRKRPPKKKADEQDSHIALQKVEVKIIGPSEQKAELPEHEENAIEKENKETKGDIEINATLDTEVKEAWDETTEDEGDDEEDEDDILPKTEVLNTVSKQVKKEESEEETEESDSEEESSTEKSESEEESSDESEEEGKKQEAKIKERAAERIMRRREEAEKNRNTSKLRSPVVCVLGHVDTGKTKILDKIRRTHVQDSEAGGITQQIGATMVPQDALKEQCKMVKNFADVELKVPGLLIIDTPGHESFSNLRSRGSSLCDIAILVVDIMHGLEPQTIESLNLLKQKKTPFIVALNKVDRLYEWKTVKNKDIQDVIKSQARNTKMEFEDRAKDVILQFANQGMNATLFYENKDPRSYISMVPTSAFTGDGMGNLMALIVELTQSMMAKRVAFSEELQATVLEVKAIPGLGTTIDVILVNGRLREGDTILLAAHDGPLVTQIRSLLMPQPLKELRVKNPYQEYKEVEGAQGVKIAGKDLDKAIAGLQLLVAHHPDEVEVLKDEVSSTLREAMSSIKLAERGVYVQASTLGSLEALLEFLKVSKIPYSGIRIGPVVKKDVMKASIMLEHDSQYAVILAFDVKVERDAQELADNLGVKIFQADIIYHLFDKFMAYRDELKQKKRDEFKNVAVFPCKLRILPQYVFNSRDPIVVGVIVEAGVIKDGTPLCVPSKEFLEIGTVTTIEVNHKSLETARRGQEVCIKIEPSGGEAPKMYGRHFDHTDMLVSKITRQSIDVCKEYFRDDLLKTDWQLMVELKKIFQIL